MNESFKIYCKYIVNKSEIYCSSEISYNNLCYNEVL